MTQEDKEYRQGRTRRQMEANQKIAAIAAIGLAAVIISMTIYNLIKYGI